MEINKKFVENLIKQWIIFRDNEFDRFKNMKCNEKYYQTGFADCLYLVIISLGGTGINK